MILLVELFPPRMGILDKTSSQRKPLSDSGNHWLMRLININVNLTINALKFDINPCYVTSTSSKKFCKAARLFGVAGVMLDSDGVAHLV